MTNVMGPQPGNEKRAEDRRRQRANKTPDPGLIQLLEDISHLPPSSLKTVMIILYLISMGAVAIIVLWMVIVALTSI